MVHDPGGSSQPRSSSIVERIAHVQDQRSCFFSGPHFTVGAVVGRAAAASARRFIIFITILRIRRNVTPSPEVIAKSM